MPRLINEIGNRHGRLTVLRQAGYKNGAAMWLCRCDCGNEVTVRGACLRNGETQSCGCLRREMDQRRLKNEVGKKYGRLTVLNRMGSSKNRQAMWLCRCDCGKEIEVLGISLRSGNTQSCGCINKERVSETQKARALARPVGEVAFNDLFCRIRGSAKIRGYTWALTKDQVKQITLQSCYYCNVEPDQKVTDRPGRNGIYIYNGLDRVNNELGYEIENVVPCCGTCNKAKNVMTQEEFLTWISRVYAHSISKG